MALIFLMSSRSTVPQTPGLSSEVAAAAGHVAVYGILAILVARALFPAMARFATVTLLAWSVSVLYGISDEYHQSFVPGRFASIDDVVFDAIGAAIGLTVYYIYLRRQRDVRAPA